MTASHVPLRVVDGRDLPATHRSLLRPGEALRTRDGEVHALPRFFYEVDSWQTALDAELTPHFGLWEFMEVDVHEPAPLRAFPRYVPCAVTAIAAALEVMRLDIGAQVRVAANGGYRSPAHAGSRSGSPHCWGTAANIYRIGTEMLDSQDRIERYSAVVRRLLPFAWIRPYGSDRGCADDHLHVDLGYLTAVPQGASEQHHDAAAQDR
jgi:hypothetical protein